MKKNIRKIIVLALCILMATQFVTTADAVMTGYYSWDDGLLGKTIFANFTGYWGLPVEIPGAGQKYHTENTEGQRVTYTGAINLTLYANYQSTLGYDNYLDAAIQNAGMLLSKTVTKPSQTWAFTIPASYATGYYEVGIEFGICDGSWTITEGRIANDNMQSTSTWAMGQTSGYISYAPNGQYEITIVPSYI